MSTAITDTTPVSVTCATPASVIHYTIDGSTPTAASPIYTVPFTLAIGNRTVKAIGITAGYQNSEIATTDYVVADSYQDFVCSGPYGGQYLAKWSLNNTLTSVGTDPVPFVPQTGLWTFGTVLGKPCVHSTPGATTTFIAAATADWGSKGFTICGSMVVLSGGTAPYLDLYKGGALDRITNTATALTGTIDSAQLISVPNAMPSGWFHLTLTYDARSAGVMQVYLNGVLQGSVSIAANVCRLRDRVSFFVQTPGASIVSAMRNVRLYSRWLPASEILAISTEDLA